MQRAGPGIYRNTFRRFAVGREIPFKLGYVGSQNELATIENSSNRLVDFGLDGLDTGL